MLVLDDIISEITGIRRELHRIPELHGEEFKTSALIRRFLISRGIEVLPPFLGTDVVADIRGKLPGKQVALRCDIDALALAEKNNLPYASIHPGKMHACGHDGHAAIMLGTALVLHKLRDTFSGVVRLIWQPGEENLAMAKDLVEAGVLDRGVFSLVGALHGQPGAPLGKIGLISGVSECACSHFSITVHGKGGHSSAPFKSCDPVLAASELVVALNSIVPRRVDPGKMAILSVCRMIADTSGNVIPEEVYLEGTLRSDDDEVLKVMQCGVREIVSGIDLSHRCRSEIDFFSNYPVCMNDPEAVKIARAAAELALGTDRVFNRDTPALSADDFGYFTSRCPGVYAKLGLGDCANLHTVDFDFPDAALESGVRFMVELARAGLK